MMIESLCIRRSRRRDGASRRKAGENAFVRRFVVPGADGEGLPLRGMRFAVKDNMSVQGQPLSNGCAAWAERRPGGAGSGEASTALCVERVLAAGATLEGHTCMDQLAYSLQGNETDHPTPVNARYPGMLPGGSRCVRASVLRAVAAPCMPDSVRLLLV